MELKSGYKTTEFWLTVIAQALGIAVLFGVVNAEQVDSLNAALESAVKSGVGLWLAVSPLVQYIKSRAELKAKSYDALG